MLCRISFVFFSERVRSCSRSGEVSQLSASEKKCPLRVVEVFENWALHHFAHEVVHASQLTVLVVSVFICGYEHLPVSPCVLTSSRASVPSRQLSRQSL